MTQLNSGQKIQKQQLLTGQVKLIMINFRRDLKRVALNLKKRSQIQGL